MKVKVSHSKKKYQGFSFTFIVNPYFSIFCVFPRLLFSFFFFRPKRGSNCGCTSQTSSLSKTEFPAAASSGSEIHQRSNSTQDNNQGKGAAAQHISCIVVLFLAIFSSSLATLLSSRAAITDSDAKRKV